jgi:hypothetical protein
MTGTRRLATLAFVGGAMAAAGGTGAGVEKPLEALPPYMHRLVDWGVRPEWSRDGRHVIFVERGLGDAYEVDW